MGAVKFSLPKMKEAISAINPDFVFLQEVQGAHRRREKRVQEWPAASQFEYMSKDVWPHYVYAQNANYHSGHHGNAILSKVPFDTYENLNLSNIPRASRSILHGQLKVDDRVVHLLCVHLGLFKTEREQQCQRLIERIQGSIPDDEPLIMAGDFNDWQTVISPELNEKLGISEAFMSMHGEHAKSFPAIKPTLRVDRIYTRGLKVLSVDCLEGKPWRTLSDHLPLLARLELS